MPPLIGNSNHSSLRSLINSNKTTGINESETRKPNRPSSQGITPSWVYLERESDWVFFESFSTEVIETRHEIIGNTVTRIDFKNVSHPSSMSSVFVSIDLANEFAKSQKNNPRTIVVILGPFEVNRFTELSETGSFLIS